MNRKHIILIAVFINAGLISAMLIAGLTSQDEPTSHLTGLEAGLEERSRHFSKLEENPLFGDSIDLAMRKSSESVESSLAAGRMESPIPISLPELEKSAETSSLSALAPSAKGKGEEPIVHKLPPLPPEPNLLAAAPAGVSMAAAPAPFTEVAVKKGDNLEKIAKNHRTTVDEIIKINRLPSSFLKAGQVLKIPTERSGGDAAPQKQKPAAEGNASPEYYTVKVGDNPWTIAMKHHIKVEELLRLNGLNEEKARKLKPGDRLRTR